MLFKIIIQTRTLEKKWFVLYMMACMGTMASIQWLTQWQDEYSMAIFSFYKVLSKDIQNLVNFSQDN